jgi:hypothetical protein
MILKEQQIYQISSGSWNKQAAVEALMQGLTAWPFAVKEP